MADREKLFKTIITNAFAWAFGSISEVEIDEIGIQQANILAMKKALEKLKTQPDYLLIDALKIEYKKLPVENIVKF